MTQGLHEFAPMADTMAAEEQMREPGQAHRPADQRNDCRY